MKQVFIVTIFSLLLCVRNVPPDPHFEIKQRGMDLITKLDSSTLAIFHDWEYATEYHEFKVWKKRCPHTTPYTLDHDLCWYNLAYHTNDDTVKLIFGHDFNFKKDFPYAFSEDTSKYSDYFFFKIKGQGISIAANKKDDFQAPPIIIAQNLLPEQVFLNANPFEFFASLQQKADDLKLYKTWYRPDAGNFIQFFLDHNYVLTYLPPDYSVKDFFKEKFEKELSGGTQINTNWNIRTTAWDRWMDR